MEKIVIYFFDKSISFFAEDGNDTIDPYPLISKEAKRILCITDSTFQKICAKFQAFCRGLAGRPKARSCHLEANKRHFSAPQQPDTDKRHFSDYEPTNAIYFNECDYRRWCRVSEWFKEFGPDAEKNTNNYVDLIKMDT